MTTILYYLKNRRPYRFVLVLFMLMGCIHTGLEGGSLSPDGVGEGQHGIENRELAWGWVDEVMKNGRFPVEGMHIQRPDAPGAAPVNGGQDGMEDLEENWGEKWKESVEEDLEECWGIMCDFLAKNGFPAEKQYDIEKLKEKLKEIWREKLKEIWGEKLKEIWREKLRGSWKIIGEDRVSAENNDIKELNEVSNQLIKGIVSNMSRDELIRSIKDLITYLKRSNSSDTLRKGLILPPRIQLKKVQKPWS